MHKPACGGLSAAFAKCKLLQPIPARDDKDNNSNNSGWTPDNRVEKSSGWAFQDDSNRIWEKTVSLAAALAEMLAYVV